VNIIEPMVITDTELSASNIPETDYGGWSAGTTYEAGARCISTSSHRIYESAQPGNLGNDPVINAGSWWVELRATNKWSAFDNRRSNPASSADEITYSITPTRDCDAIALFGLTAGTLRIEVWDGVNSIYDQSFTMADTSHVVSMYTYLFGGIVYSRQKVLNGFPGYIGHRIDLTISAPGATAKVGHIVLGRNHLIGEVLDGASIDLNSHSRKGYDDFGDEYLVRRGTTRKITIPFKCPTVQARRITDIIASVDGMVTAFYADPSISDYGVEGLGFTDGLSQPLDAAGESIFTLTMKTIK